MPAENKAHQASKSRKFPKKTIIFAQVQTKSVFDAKHCKKYQENHQPLQGSMIVLWHEVGVYFNEKPIRQ